MDRGNIIELIKKDGTRELVKSFPGLSVNFHGKDNHILIYEGTIFRNCALILISDMYIEIKNSIFQINNLKIFGNSSEVTIGENFSCWGVEIRCHEQKTAVKIGDNCMFSEEILIYPTDVHTIYCENTGKLLNRGKPILIGNHVWCSRGVKFCKGSVIGNDNIISLEAIVTDSTETKNNVIIGGSPAKIIKENINWSRETPWEYLMKHPHLG